MSGPHRKLLPGTASAAGRRTKPMGAPLVNVDMACPSETVGAEARRSDIQTKAEP